jgi:hypothetical protein
MMFNPFRVLVAELNPLRIDRTMGGVAITLRAPWPMCVQISPMEEGNPTKHAVVVAVGQRAWSGSVEAAEDRIVLRAPRGGSIFSDEVGVSGYWYARRDGDPYWGKPMSRFIAGLQFWVWSAAEQERGYAAYCAEKGARAAETKHEGIQ